MKRIEAMNLSDDECRGKLMRFREDEKGIVEGTILERDRGRYRVEWHDGYGTSGVSVDSDAIIEIV